MVIRSTYLLVARKLGNVHAGKRRYLGHELYMSSYFPEIKSNSYLKKNVGKSKW